MFIRIAQWIVLRSSIQVPARIKKSEKKSQGKTGVYRKNGSVQEKVGKIQGKVKKIQRKLTYPKNK